MGDLLLELLTSALGGFVPDRIATGIAAALLMLCALAFAAIGAFVLLESVAGGDHPLLGMLAFPLWGLGWLSFRLARKGIASARRGK